MSATTPEPTVLPPSRIANLNPFSIAIGVINSIVGKEGLKTQKENIDKAIELESKRQDPEAFLSILDNFLKPTDAAYWNIS